MARDTPKELMHSSSRPMAHGLTVYYLSCPTLVQPMPSSSRPTALALMEG